MKAISIRRIASYFCALVAAQILVTSCGSVPLTGRKQILLVSDQEVYEAGLTQYNAYMEEASVSADSRKTAMVKSVGKKLSEATEKYLNTKTCKKCDIFFAD